MIRQVILLLGAAVLASGVAVADERPPATVYKSPSCGCCAHYVEYLREAGFPVEVVDTDNLDAIKRQHGVPAGFAGCHTTVVGGYAVEGHVPLGVLERFLSERPAVSGISLPGMPGGSPGMTGVKRAPFRIYQFSADRPDVELYAVD